MSHPYAQLFVHLVWGTFDRLPVILPEHEARLYGAIEAKCRELDSRAVAIEGCPDHIHLLVEFHPTCAVSSLVGQIKGATSHLMNHALNVEPEFRWQGSYGAFTVGKRSLEQVAEYVRNQKTHHAEGRLMDALEHCGLEPKTAAQVDMQSTG